MSFNVSIDRVEDLLRVIRALVTNRRGPMSAAARQMTDTVLDRIRDASLIATRNTLRSNLSEGPPLSQGWVDEKEASWQGRRWYVDLQGNTVQVARPGFAVGPDHKGVWTGFLDSRLDAWVNTNYTIRGGSSIGVGYRGSALHPIQGIDEQTLATWIHYGTGRQPARPFINAQSNLMAMRNATRQLLQQAITNILTTGAP